MRSVTFVLLLWAPLLAAQHPVFDSIEQRLAAAQVDTQRLQLLQDLTDQAFRVDLAAALAYARRGVALAERCGDKQWQPRFYEMQGRMHANLGHLDSASLSFDKAMKGYLAVGNKKGQATTTFKIAWVHTRKGETDLAIAANLRALRLMEALNDPAGIADALSRISGDLYNQGQSAEALKYARRSIEICQKNNLQEELPFSLRYAGNACIALGDNTQALDYYNQAIALIRANNLSPIDLIDLINCRGNAFKHLGRYTEALDDYKSSLKNAQKANIPGGIFTAIGNLGQTYMLMGRYAEALPYQLKTIELQEQLGDLGNLTENYSHASTIYEKIGDYRNALRYRKKAFEMRDSTMNRESDAKISQLRTEYETEKKEAIIATQEQQIAQQRTVQWLGFGVVTLLAFLAFNFWRNAVARQKSNALLAAKNAENELLLREIHHRIKNNLEVVSSLLALQSAQIDDPNVRDAMQEGQNRVQSISIVHQKLYQRDNLAAIELKDYFLNLSESVLDTFGAEGRVRIECTMQEIEVDVDTAVPLGLIVNELLTNTLKYAFPNGQKGAVKIKLEKNADTLHLEVADNGIGKSSQTRGTGFGSQLVQLLTRQLNGVMREEQQEGTVVQFDFNLKKAA